MSANEPNDFDVGFCKPPKRSQFRKGTSGNPKGRPKGTPNLATLSERVLQQKIIITKNGRRETVTKFEAALMALADKVLKGDIVAIPQPVALASSLADEANIPAADHVSEADLKIMNRVFERVQRSERGASAFSLTFPVPG